MSESLNFKTATMARVYERQGYWEKAAEIYRYLLERDPARQDLAQALALLETKKTTVDEALPEDLVAKIRHWLELLQQYHRRQELRGWQARCQALRRRGDAPSDV